MKVSIFKIPPNLKTIDSIFIFNVLSLSFYKEEFIKLPWYPPIILNLESVNYGALDLVNNVWNLYHTYLNLWFCKEIEKNPSKSQVYTLHIHINTILYYTCFYIVLNFIFLRRKLSRNEVKEFLCWHQKYLNVEPSCI